jgi:hypothetical protein
MVRGSPGPRNRTRVDVLWTWAHQRKALKTWARGLGGGTLIYVPTGTLRGALSNATGFLAG